MPLWFREELDEDSGTVQYIFNDKYFKNREIGNWDECPDLF
jgi:hypothetical protein